MKKSIAVLGMAKFPVSKKIEFARYIVTSMTGNSNFPTPSPALSVITANVNSVEAASITAKGGGKDETAVLRAKMLVLELSLKSLCSYVETVANTNFLTAEAVILSAGLNVKKAAPPKANGFRIVAGKNPGELDIRTDSKPRSFYQFEMTLTPDVEDSWEQVYAGTRSRFIATGLESGERYHFRVLRTDKTGAGPWSNVLHAIYSPFAILSSRVVKSEAR